MLVFFVFPCSEIFPKPWLSTFSSNQDHQGVVLVWSRCNSRSAIWEAGWDTMLWQCCTIGNCTKLKQSRRRRHSSHQSTLSVMVMDCNIPEYLHKSNTGGRHTSLQSPLYLMIPLSRKNTWMFFNYKQNRIKLSRIPARALS